MCGVCVCVFEYEEQQASDCMSTKVSQYLLPPEPDFKCNEGIKRQNTAYPMDASGRMVGAV